MNPPADHHAPVALDAPAEGAEAGSPRAPRGPDEVRTALIAAASELFARKGPAGVSVREIAAAAGVNHGLVHHYFGSKEALLHTVIREGGARVMARLTDGLLDSVGAEADLDPEAAADAVDVGSLRMWEAMRADDGWRTVVRALLDGYEEDVMIPGTPLLGALVDSIAEAQAAGTLTDEVRPEVITVAGAALLWGSLVLEPLLAVTPVGDMPADELARQVGLLWWRAIGATAAGNDSTTHTDDPGDGDG